ncbi:ethylmalonyl-CoA decarboxylase-like isoform X2 [Periplaneta americana]|uniref:ethylmalonyl-CoA decarboxylase-like isoform X2 n=1 Tax=Periplaneta americana TaxID=6978 RepID=UPI0037E76904
MWNILGYLRQSKPLPAKYSQYKYLSYYSGQEPSTAEIRARLLQSTGGSVDLEKNEETGIATLCLNHPERRNAVSGGDLNMARLLSNPDDGFSMAIFMQKVLHRLENLPLISVALIEGTGALGGGSEIAVACDFRLLTSNAGGIAFVHTRLGITPAWGGCTRLVCKVGYTKALDLLATGRKVSGEEALKIGIVDGIVDSENAFTEAVEWLKIRVQSDVEVVKSLKTMARNAEVMSYDESLAEEKRLFAPLWGGPANKAALSKNIKHK